jgi:hypothetical protein
VFLLLNDVCLGEKQQIPLEVRTLTITSSINNEMKQGLKVMVFYVNIKVILWTGQV